MLVEMANIEIINDCDLKSWYTLPDIPTIELNEVGIVTYGHIRVWIEKNIKNKVYLIAGKYSYSIIFSEKEDYIAFKLAFPKYCK